MKPINLQEGSVLAASLPEAAGSLFHEGLHRHQDEVAEDITVNGLPASSFMRSDLLMLWVNDLPGAQPGSAVVGDLYRRSPWEQDAWAATDVFRKGVGLPALL